MDPELGWYCKFEKNFQNAYVWIAYIWKDKSRSPKNFVFIKVYFRDTYSGTPCIYMHHLTFNARIQYLIFGCAVITSAGCCDRIFCWWLFHQMRTSEMLALLTNLTNQQEDTGKIWNDLACFSVHNNYLKLEHSDKVLSRIC